MKGRGGVSWWRETKATIIGNKVRDSKEERGTMRQKSDLSGVLLFAKEKN